MVDSTRSSAQPDRRYQILKQQTDRRYIHQSMILLINCDFHDSGSPGSSITCCLQQSWQGVSCDFLYFIHLIFGLPLDLFPSPIPSIIVFSRTLLFTTCPKYESFCLRVKSSSVTCLPTCSLTDSFVLLSGHLILGILFHHHG